MKTPRKRCECTNLTIASLLGTLLALSGCTKKSPQIDQGWTPPFRVTESQNALDGGGDLYKWHDTMILLQQRYDWRAKSSTCSIMIRNNDPSNSWTQLPLSGVPSGYNFYDPAFDEASDKIMFDQGYIEHDQLMMSAIFVRLPGSRVIQVGAESRWTTDVTGLFGEARPNVRLAEFNEPGKRTWPALGNGILYGSSLDFPCCIEGFTYNQAGVAVARGPNANGVFHSADSGSTWQMELISEFEAFSPSVCKTKGYCYYFANGGMGMQRGFVLWFSRKPIEGSSWDAPKVVAKTVAYGVNEQHSIVTESDTIHICWLDSRHEKRTWNFAHPRRGNYEVAYCQRKDSVTSWRKDIILSSGVMFSRSPSMSVDGNQIVVAWAGAQTAHAWGFNVDPSDIYYASSKDGGRTWARPLKITDGAKDGITSGRPQVAVKAGVIHLFYVQGKWDQNSQVHSQGSWPVYYQQRPFPD